MGKKGQRWSDTSMHLSGPTMGSGSRERMHQYIASKHASDSSSDPLLLFWLSVQVTICRIRLNRQLVALGDTESSHRHRWSDLLSLRARWIIFRFFHVVITLVVWQHFFYIKFRQQEKGVPDAAPNRGLKRFTPPFEFGAMHAILLQLSVIPLTMCRSLLAWLSTSTPLPRVLPFEHIVQFHIFVGYFFCTIMVLSVIFFFTFFGKVCSDYLNDLDPADLCRNFSREIMFTGYGILVATLIILSSSFFRSRLRFEIFYWMHLFFVFSMFLLAVLHTMDDEFRNNTPKGKLRSQGWVWFSTSLVTYFADRCWSIAGTRTSRIVKAEQSFDLKTVVLYVRKPAGFHFQAGQHASIQIPAIDGSWHPFSIGSAPLADELVFFIQVQGRDDSWTARLSDSKMLTSLVSHGGAVRIMGPYGYPIGGTSKHDHVVAIGTGTGIVPMFSLMWERARRLGLLQKDVLLETRRANRAAHAALERAGSADEALRKMFAKDEKSSTSSGSLMSELSAASPSFSPASALRQRGFGRSRKQSPPSPEPTPTKLMSELLPVANGGDNPAASGDHANGEASTPHDDDDNDDEEEEDMVLSPSKATRAADGHLSIDVQVRRSMLAELVVTRAQLKWRHRLLERLGPRSSTVARINARARREEAHRVIGGLTVLLALVELAFVPAVISWSNLPARAPAIEIHAQMLRWSTIGGVSLFILHRAYLLCFPVRFGRSIVLTIVDGIACVLQAVFVTLLLHPWYNAFRLDPEATPAVALTVGQQGLLAIFGAYRIVRLLQSTAGGVSTGSANGHSDESESTQLLGQERFTLVWVTRSADLLIGYLPEIDAMLELLNRSLYVDNQAGTVGELMQLHIYCTDPDPAMRQHLQHMAQLHHLKDTVHLYRPDLEEIIVNAMKADIVSSQDAAAPHTTLLTFCGSPQVASACLYGCAQANALAARLGQAARMEFREEFYGHTAGQRRKGRTSRRHKPDTELKPVLADGKAGYREGPVIV